MLDQSHPLLELLKTDKRYKFDAYLFVFEALNYAQSILNMGSEQPSDEDRQQTERHVTGGQLCEAIRQFALKQYGYLAHDVLTSWGIHNTDDFGQIVFNLIEIGEMRKTPEDRLEDFSNVFDFETALRKEFKIGSINSEK